MPRKNSYNKFQEGLKAGSEGVMPIRKRACRFCVDKQLRIDFKDAKALRPYISERDKINPSRISGLCAYHQHRLTEAIKRARIMGLVSFSPAQRQTV